MRKILSVLIVISIFFTMISVSAQAYSSNSNEKTYGDFDYIIKDGYAVITDHEKGEANVAIPSVIEGYVVKELGPKSFYYDSMETVTIPNTITIISENAFNGCDSLSEINIPSSVTSIGSEAFKYCDGLTKIIIPKSVKYLGSNVFASCDALKEIIIESNLNLLVTDTFYRNNNAKIIFNGKINEINSEAFSHCNNIEVTFNSTVKKIDDDAFDFCKSVTIMNDTKYVKNWVKKQNNDKYNTSDFKFINNSKIVKPSLSNTNFQYDGKNKKPNVIVKDSLDGTIKSSFYTVEYDADSKNVGKHKVVITLKEPYSTVKTLYYKILPTTKSSLILTAKEKIDIEAKSNKKITYKSLNNKIARVSSSGKITGVSIGKTTIVVESNDVAKNINVTVREPGVKISSDKAVYRGKKLKVTATTYPQGKKITWSVNNKKIAKISSNGVLKGIKRGTVTVTATFKYNGKTYKTSKKVNVKSLNPNICVTMSRNSKYTKSIAFSVDNYGSKPLKVLNMGSYSNGYITKRNVELFNSKAKTVKSIKIKPKDGSFMGFSFKDNSGVAYYGDSSSLTFYFEYDGETYKAVCYSNIYGLNQVKSIYRIV